MLLQIGFALIGFKGINLQLQSLENTPTEEVEESFYRHHESEQRNTETIKRYSEIVKKLLEKLPESERTVVTLYYLGEMTAKEIGKFLGVSVNTIKSRLHRARSRLKQDEPMIREAISNFQISPNLVENIMREVTQIKPAAPSGSKPLVPWVFSASAVLVIVLMLGIGNRYLTRFQKPYSLDAQSEMTVDIVDASIVEDLEAELDIRNQLGEHLGKRGRDDGSGEKLNQVSTDQGNIIRLNSLETYIHDSPQWHLPDGCESPAWKRQHQSDSVFTKRHYVSSSN